MGGQAGLGFGVSSTTGLYVDGIQPADNNISMGAGGGVAVNFNVSVGYPTSQPTTVYSASTPAGSLSVGYAPGDDGGFGTLTVQVGEGAKLGAYVTSTDTINLYGRGPENPEIEVPERDMHAGVQETTDGGAPPDGAKAGKVDVRANDDVDEVEVDDSESDSDDGLEAPDPIVPSIAADSTEGRAY
jgi:hypothetical protein